MSRIAMMMSAALFLALVGAVTAEDTRWSYKGEEGPEHWGELEDGFKLCETGWNQSPIDLVADLTADLPELVFDYTHPGRIEEVNTGHAIQENVIPGNFLLIRDDRFELKQFHFHSPSEHLVNGEVFPMEIHLVHQNEEGEYVVLGVLFEEGERNEQMDQLPSFRRARGEDPYEFPMDFNTLVPNRQDYFLYNGSLTTPPCTEGVHWIVLKQPLIASPEQIQHYHDLLGFDNNRPIQPHNARTVVE